MVLVALNTSTSDTMHSAMKTDQMILSPLKILEKKPSSGMRFGVWGMGFEVWGMGFGVKRCGSFRSRGFINRLITETYQVSETC